MNKSTILLVLTMVLTYTIKAQQKIEGFVYEQKNNNEKEFLPGANVYWLNTEVGAITDVNGHFMLQEPTEYPSILIISYIGYQTDSIKFERYQPEISVKLTAAIRLKKYEFVKKESSTSMSVFDPIKVETLNKKELQKAACCNISESFETNASVDVNFTDAVSGTKKIQMLGLDGIYTQIQTENIPNVRGLSSAFGLTFIPGTWAESIQIKKGAGSVINGYESITGQINIELEKPEKTDKLFLNLYGNYRGRAELNLHQSFKLNSKWSSMYFLHASNQQLKWDDNNDSFLDMPQKQQYSLLNRWKYQGEKTEAQIGIKGLYDEINGGQNTSINNLPKYQTNIISKQLEVFTKNGFFLPSLAGKSLGIITNVKYHSHNSMFGNRKFNSIEQSAYLNTLFQTYLGNEKHKLISGVSFLYDNYENSLNDSLFSRNEIVPGAYTEYTYNTEKNTLVAGVRSDYHILYGNYISPRLHYKYNFSDMSAFRLSAGKGFRTANVFIENMGLFASSRQIYASANLIPEEAWNYGTSIVHKINKGANNITLSVDYYFTNFVNQVVVDMEDVRSISFYNLNGKSYSHAFQPEIAFETPQFSIKTAYKLTDVKTQYNIGLLTKPYVQKHRVLLNLAYNTNFDKWKFDITGLFHGLSRIPSTKSNTINNQRANLSEEYFTINMQVTKNFKKFETYFGVENLTRYIQKNSIINAENPYGTEFDASMIWGPVSGRNFYVGLRYIIK